MVYAIMMKMKEGKTFDSGVVGCHVEHIRSLDDEGRLVICGPFKDGRGGMVILRAQSPEEAETLARRDPFIKEGFEDYEVRELVQATRANNYLLDANSSGTI